MFNHVTRLIKSGEKYLDQEKFADTVLMSFSKTFDSTPRDLLITKLHADAFSKNSLLLFYWYLKRRKQNVRIINTRSIFQILLSGVLQGSIVRDRFIQYIYKWPVSLNVQFSAATLGR